MTKPYRLYLGDCREVLKQIPDESIDVVFADPPYRLSNGGFTCQGGRMVSVNKGGWDKSMGLEGDHAFNLEWIAECQRVLKPNGTIWISGTYHNIYSCGFALQELRFHLLNDITWFKPNASPNLSCRFFTASHETLLWAKKTKTARHTFNYEAMKGGDFPEDRLKVPQKQMRSVWAMNSTPQEEKQLGKHPTQKPLKLMERVVLASSNPKDLILDPFCGSGTTGVAAVKHGRRFIGVDIEQGYINLAQRRLESSLPHKDSISPLMHPEVHQYQGL